MKVQQRESMGLKRLNLTAVPSQQQVEAFGGVAYLFIFVLFINDKFITPYKTCQQRSLFIPQLGNTLFPPLVCPSSF